MRLTCTDVSVEYGSVAAVKDVSLSLEEGRVYGLLGANGAGKSSLFKAIAGRVRATSGQILIEDQNVTRLSEHERVRRGIVGTHQTPMLFGELTVWENVAVGASARGLDRTAVDRTVTECLESLRLGDRRDALAKDLTIYEMRLLEIARALSTDPRVLLLDEALAGIREAEIPGMLSVIKGIADTGVTILMVEHILDVIENATEYVFLLDFGELVAADDTSSIRVNDKFREIYLGGSAEEDHNG